MYDTESLSLSTRRDMVEMESHTLHVNAPSIRLSSLAITEPYIAI